MASSVLLISKQQSNDLRFINPKRCQEKVLIAKAQVKWQIEIYLLSFRSWDAVNKFSSFDD